MAPGQVSISFLRPWASSELGVIFIERGKRLSLLGSCHAAKQESQKPLRLEDKPPVWHPVVPMQSDW